MSQYELDIALFGRLDLNAEEGLYEDYEITLSGQRMQIGMYTGLFLAPGVLKRAACSTL